MKTKPFETIKNNLKKIEFTINPDYTNSYVRITKKSGGFFYDFIVNYDKVIKNHVEASYLSPNECDVEFNIVGIQDLEVYNFKSEAFELTDEQIIELSSIIEQKIIGEPILR